MAVVAVALLAWLLLKTTGDDRPQQAGSVGSATHPGVAHVHGLGIDPADDALIVATHFGSFRVTGPGDAERIGGSFQDTMGFTVVGPNEFLGSGHPDVAGMRKGQPGRLGLIGSDDGGVTWSTLSLSGKADFHGLAAAHGKVYGLDASTGRFMVSADRKKWDVRSTVELSSFAVDPDDEDRIVGTSQKGLLESTDGGRTWKGSDGPPLLTVSWTAEAGLWGAEPDGTVWQRSRTDWSQKGKFDGQPQAFLATADALYAAADTAGVTSILRSTDGDRTWDVFYRDEAT